VLEALRSEPELTDIPVIMLTGFSERLRQTSYATIQGLMLEVDDYLDKPVRPQELVRRVKAVLRVKSTKN